MRYAFIRSYSVPYTASFDPAVFFSPVRFLGILELLSQCCHLVFEFLFSLRQMIHLLLVCAINSLINFVIGYLI